MPARVIDVVSKYLPFDLLEEMNYYDQEEYNVSTVSDPLISPCNCDACCQTRIKLARVEAYPGVRGRTEASAEPFFICSLCPASTNESRTSSPYQQR